MFYPTGKNTQDRIIVCLEDIKKDLNLLFETNNNDVIENTLNYLNDNDYCLESWQVKDFFLSNGYEVSVINEEVDGGGGDFSTVDNVNGMGDVKLPSNDGTNASFYDYNKVGSGDIPNKKKSKNKRRILTFRDFYKTLKTKNLKK